MRLRQAQPVRRCLGSRVRHMTRLALAAGLAAGVAGQVAQARELAVCADPSNLPFSNRAGEGLENRLAELLAQELHATVRYAWGVQRRGFLRRTLQARTCDVVMGLPDGLPGVALTRPYYRSSYVFVSPTGQRLQGLDDPRLAGMKIGLQALGAEGANTPPAASLAARGLSANVVGYPMWAEEGVPSAPARLVEAVARGELGTAVVWGPIGGYYAARQDGRVEVSTLRADPRLPDNEFTFALSVGVRRGDEALRDELQAALDRRQDAVLALLQSFSVPLAAAPPAACAAGPPAAEASAPLLSPPLDRSGATSCAPP